MQKLFIIFFVALVSACALAGCDVGRSPSRPSNLSAELIGANTDPHGNAPAAAAWRCVAGGMFAGADCARGALHVVAGAAATAPTAPIGLSASVSGSTVLLAWTAPSGVAPSSYVVEAGSASGLIDLANFDTGSAAVTLSVTGVPAGSYFVRVRAKNSGGSGATSNEVLLVVAGGACTAAPGAPVSLSAAASGTSATLSWTPAAGGCAPSGYVIEAGSAPGLSNLANFNTGSTATSFSTSGIGAGTYFVRVRAANAGGSSAASNEASFTSPSSTPTPCAAPSAPGGLTASASGTTVIVSWSAPAGAPTSYRVEVGATAGASNVSSADTGSAATSASLTLAAAKYFIRVKAVNGCGTSSASNEVTVTTTAPAVPAVITITNGVASPKNLTISQGTQVTFVNNDANANAHEMVSDPHPEHTDCPEINQVGFLNPGQSRQTGNLNIVRTCGFHDHLNALSTGLKGTITIR